MHPQRLPNAQIQHNLLGATGDRVRPHISVQPLNLGTLPSTRVTESAKDLTRFSSTEFERGCGLSLEACNGTPELQHCFGLIHDLALVNDVLKPVVAGFNLACHVGKLEADDGVVDEFLAKRLPLVGVLDRFLVADPREADALNDDANSFMVEVRHEH